ncbi:hypothetical protein CLAFUW4_12468 [Fulvia fulva]|uniref:Uncharacterized protein n=1 Tax=Passalora fulva TaxID=5499 RepID=A0A9Q8USJ9_PASFU|nr:uncharacterized protein CLAFUR5_11495 [Fulvia fulva]KAK4618027.1 hypothetical protein CLAFUR4_12473 [Fulvia fulva]KAK4619195.1 hypothetical protein CLAFUR0_12484 [Fulvia fulva]UJO20861.1 hypothetical protein CLAFUR5_11495 [Fulvia fulva]WPV17918.1 hypothetical protein CLAFUW4_12468 [Fulvia fulva]WPV33233.1 hypothetical protein CLAFUW7_12475 [Fulvia fulva]
MNTDHPQVPEHQTMESLTRLFTFSESLSQLYRSLWTQHTNAQISAENRPSLDCLLDDVLLIVLDHLEQFDVENAFQAGFLTHKLSDVVRFSTVSKRLRGLAEARILRRLHLGPSWSASKLSQALRAIRSPDGVRCYTKSLKIDLWLEGATDMSKHHWILMRELLETVSSLEHVRVLDITATESSALALQAVVEDVHVRLEGITELILSPNMDWLIPKCPDLQALSTNDWVVVSRDKKSPTTRLIEAVASIDNLQHFALHSPWHSDTLHEVLAALPRIRSIGMLSGNCTSNLDDRLSVLRKFQHLERLQMTDASKLVRVQTLQTWTTPLYTETMTAAQAHVTEKVFKYLPRLKELILGPAFRAWVVRRHADGRIDLKWEATVVRPSLQEQLAHMRERMSCGFDTERDEANAAAQEDELAEQMSLAETMNSRTDVQTLADVMHDDLDDDDDAEQLRRLQEEMAM